MITCLYSIINELIFWFLYFRWCHENGQLD